MRFGLVYGHAASNHGDIAINRGAVRLFRRIAPECAVHTAFLDPNESYMGAARASLALDDGMTSSVHAWRSAGTADGDELDAVAEAIRDPEAFLARLGLQDCQAVFYNSGEHLFAPGGDENAIDLLWRVAAALAVKNAGLPLLMLPSTFGPCDGPIGRRLLRMFCQLSDGLAGREPRSADALREFAPDRVAGQWLLDPAFFMDREADGFGQVGADSGEGGLGLVLRLENYGLRMGKSRSSQALAAHKQASFRDSRSHGFAMDLARAYRDAGGSRIRILVQTLADRDLSAAIARDMSEQLADMDVSLQQPASLDDYIASIARLDRLVSARFHACIFAMLCGRPVFGVHASVHGHKMPSLFAALGLGAHCAPLDGPGTPLAALTQGDASETDARLQTMLQAKRSETEAWLTNALRQPARSADLLGMARDAGAALMAVSRQMAEAKQRAAMSETDRYRRRNEESREEKARAEAKLARQADDFAAQIATIARDYAQSRAGIEQNLARTAEENSRLQRELKSAGDQAKRTSAEFAAEGRGLRSRILRLEEEVRALSESRRFRLGSAMADAFSGWRGLARLPSSLLHAWRSAPAVAATTATATATAKATSADLGSPAPSRSAKAKPPSGAKSRFGGHNVLTAEQKRWVDEQIDAAFDQGGDAARFVDSLGDMQPAIRSFCLARASAKAKERGLLEDAYRYGRSAHEAFENQMSCTALTAAAYNTCRFDEARRLAQETRAKFGTLPASVTRMLDEAEGYADLADAASALALESAGAGESGRSVYFLHSSLPHMSGGYALRSHGLIGGVHSAGYDIRPYTRPGFPADIRAGGDGGYPELDRVDGVAYRRTTAAVLRSGGEHRYMRACIDTFGEVLDRERPEVVHARSTYLISIPALIAARRRGLPFVYEVSGLWELVHESREDAAANKARTERMRFFESLVMRSADRVITLTEAMREELLTRGVDPARISLAPNSVDPSKYLPRPRDTALAAELDFPEGVPVIGYIGSFVDYEGLDDLLEAAGRLAAEGADFRLLLVGDGAEYGKIQALASDVRLVGKVLLTGRVAFDRVPAYYSLVDICPFPRKPWEVCEVVSPMKPFEPMAMEKAVVVSDTRALCDIVMDGETGLHFRKGDVDALARVLARLIADPGLRARLGAQARQWVIANRSWDAMGARVVEQYREAVEQAAQGRN